jgi:hypothetical protein
MSTIAELEAAYEIVDRAYTDHYGAAKPKEKKDLDRQWKIADRALAIGIKSKFEESDNHIKELTRELSKARKKFEEKLGDLKSVTAVIGAVADVIRLMGALGTLIAG